MSIRLLPPELADRIAAGEVVERPAAVVKELVENALDAGAGRIAVTLEGGGIGRIVVEDDGAGIAAADLELAVARHATSKILGDDLVGLRHFGFRGEALAAIGAVARLTLASRPRGSDGAAIVVEHGRVGPVAPAALNSGTRVSVENLFAAVPARLKFLKSTRSEGAAAAEIARTLAMAHPEVGFVVTLEGRQLLAAPSETEAERQARLLAEAGALIKLHAVREGMRLSGLVSPPTLSRASAAEQHLFVNRRPVADKLLKVALRVACQGLIEAGRHPIAALFLDLPAEEVDVNVHPAKAEVRFAAPDHVRGFVISALRMAFGGTALPPRPAAPIRAAPIRPGPIRPALALVHPRAGPGSPPAQAGLADATLPLPLAPSGRGVLALARDPAPTPASAPTSAPTPVSAPEHPLGAALAQVLSTYIVAETADGALVLVDQHAAHERITHQRLADALAVGGVARQALLVPVVVELGSRAPVLLEQAVPLARLGLGIEPFGPGAVLVREVPALLAGADPSRLLQDAADALEEDVAAPLAARLDRALARLACHGSVRAGRRLNGAEMDALLRQIESTPNAHTCSHGRPTWIRLDRAALEKLFGRR
ncbi:MAG: DNA mismatch repair endonuclease MutL [Acetobacteraceae bacterium]|nr:DNA mismatch repair endonuclease MutL [Acetobacteraceae bacterium]